MIGQTISRYRLEEKLGEGGMGVVYRASDLHLGRTVAVKMLRPSLAGDVSLRRRLAVEAHASSSLNHAAIATLHDFEVLDGNALLVYEFIPGRTLRAIEVEGRMELPSLVLLFIGIAEGMAAAHKAGVIHRDLKPENVMVREDGQVKILDFGLSKVFGLNPGTSTIATAVTVPGVLLGTVAYMSPEQLEGEDVDYRSDIFSFGTMLFEAATRRHPFAGKSPSSTIGNILKEEPREPGQWTTGAPLELERIARKCIRKKRDERYQSMREILVDLEAVRREIDSGESSRGSLLAAAEDFSLPLRTGFLRAGFMLIQAAYLCVYAAVCYWGEVIEFQPVFGVSDTEGLIVTLALAMCGVAVRLYLITGIGWKHPDAGRKFRRLFPALLLFDGIWAAAPLLLWRRIAEFSLFFVVLMAYAPFAQRTLVYSIYPGSRHTSRVHRSSNHR